MPDLATDLAIDLAGAAANPYAAYGAIVDVDPRYGFTTDTGVDLIVDQIGSYEYAQGVGSQQPTRTASDADFGGRPSLSFAAASSQYLVETGGLGALVENATYSIAWVAKKASDGALMTPWSAGRSTSNNYYLLEGYAGTNLRQTTRRSASSSTVNGTVTIDVATGAHLVVATFDASDEGYVTRVDSGADSTGTFTQDPSSTDRTGIGALVRNTLTGYMDGKIARLLIFNTELAGADLTAVEALLTAEYGL